MQRMKKNLSMTKRAIYQRKYRKQAAAPISAESPRSRAFSDADYLHIKAINDEITEVFRVLKAVQLLTENDPMLKMGIDRALLHMSEAAVNLHEFLSGDRSSKAKHE
jgi:hypothetical protein